MKIIAHRGLLDGPDKNIENTLEQFNEALSEGFDIEVDVHVAYIEYNYDANGNSIKNSTPKVKFRIGHDATANLWVDDDCFNNLASQFPDQMIWLHCKDVETLDYFINNMADRMPNVTCFFHQSDDVTLTEGSLLWTFPTTKFLGPWSICVLPEQNMTPSQFKSWYARNSNIFGVCTDYAHLMRKAIT